MLESQQPSNSYLIEYLIALSMISLSATLAFKLAASPSKMVEACGVSIRRVAKAVREIERKVFHTCGLLVPLTHQLLLRYGVSNTHCTALCVAITVVGWVADLSRIHIPWVERNWPMRSILREREHKRLTGACFFSLGCTMTIAISPPSIAMASILFLVLGDMSAAIIGVSFGGDKVLAKLGREGKKSMEGSTAMFCVCFVVGCSMFAGIHLREYPVFFGAFAATLTELYEPLRLNDNLTIPFFASLAMQWAFARIQTCGVPEPAPLMLALERIFQRWNAAIG